MTSSNKFALLESADDEPQKRESSESKQERQERQKEAEREREREKERQKESEREKEKEKERPQQTQEPDLSHSKFINTVVNNLAEYYQTRNLEVTHHFLFVNM